MSEKLEVNLILTRKEWDDFKSLVKLLRHDPRFADLPWEYFFSLDPIINALQKTENLNDKLKSLTVQDADCCASCSHSVDFHARKFGLCTKESCSCWEFIIKGELIHETAGHQ